MKRMSIDYGRRRIGLAVTDETGRFIVPIGTIDRTRSPEPFRELSGVIEREHPAELVIGLPLDSREQETAMSREIRGFAKKLGRRHCLPVRLIDESFSSARARRIGAWRRKKRRREKKNVDRVAACCLLEDFLREQP